jgi:hypothetical protein
MKLFKLLICGALFGFCFIPFNTKAVAEDSFSISVLESIGEYGEPGESKVEYWKTNAALQPVFVQDCDGQELWICLNHKSGELYGKHFLPICSNKIKSWCISNFTIVDINGTDDKLIFNSYLNKSVIEGNSKLNLIPGTSPSIWESKSKKSYYLFKILVTSGLDLSKRSKSFKPIRIIASISEIKKISDVPQKLMQGTHTFLNCPQDAGQRCVAIHNISENTRFNLKFRIPEVDAAWVFGRLDQPIISKKSFDKNLNEISISANALTVPEFKSKITRSSVLKRMETYSPTKDGLISGLQLSAYLLGGDQGDFNTFDFWLENSDEMATGTSNYWSFQTSSLRDEGDGYWSRCNNISSFSGLLTTNATVYNGDTPDYKDSYLNYQIGAPHFLSDGSVFEGKYYLNLRADLAKCLYGIKGKTARATVRITYSDKSPRIETESLKNSSGWYNLKVDGIEFSSPKIRVKLN